jgi:hypothetical protein
LLKSHIFLLFLLKGLSEPGVIAVPVELVPVSGADPVWMPMYSWEYGVRRRLAPFGESSYVVRVVVLAI